MSCICYNNKFFAQLSSASGALARGKINLCRYTHIANLRYND